MNIDWRPYRESNPGYLRERVMKTELFVKVCALLKFVARFVATPENKSHQPSSSREELFKRPRCRVEYHIHELLG